MVLPMSVIVLLAVGADWPAGVADEGKIGAGINTGIIRSMAGTGSVVTAAGFVFAFACSRHAGRDMIVIRAGGLDHWAGPAVRHAGRAVADDTVDRGAHGQMVLVAAARAAASEAAAVAQGCPGGVGMRRRIITGVATALMAMPLVLRQCLQRTGTTDFATELHGFGIYGQRDYNAAGEDHDASG